MEENCAKRVDVCTKVKAKVSSSRPVPHQSGRGGVGGLERENKGGKEYVYVIIDKRRKRWFANCSSIKVRPVSTMSTKKVWTSVEVLTVRQLSVDSLTFEDQLLMAHDSA